MQHLVSLVGKLAKGEVSLDQVFDGICHDIHEKIGSTRASVWIFNPLHTAIICQALYDSRSDTYQRGTVLKEDDFEEYFKAIKTDLKIVAPDAEHHPATSCFQDVYFEPLDIRSLLDHVVLKDGEPTGILCCEHCGDIKQWSEADEKYLTALASVLSLTFKYVKV